MSFKSVMKNLFGGSSIPMGPTAQQLYSGPQAFGSYRPEAAQGSQYDSYSNAALGALGDIAEGGWTQADQAAQGQAQRQANRAESSQRQAVMQQAQARGALNSGNAFLGSLQAQQGAATRANEAATSRSIAGADRRLQGAMGQAQIGQAMAGQQMQRGSAVDQFNQWATGANANALQTAYGNQMQRYQAQQQQQQQMWDRIMGLGSMAAGGIGRGGG